MMLFEYEEAPPPAELRDVILSFWSFRTTDECPPSMEHTVWPDGCASLAITRIPGIPDFALCIKPRAEARVTVVPRGSQYWGVRFWPDTACHVFGMPASQLTDGPAPAAISTAASCLVQSFGAAAEGGWELLSQWSLDHVPHSVPIDDAVRAAVRHITLAEGGARVSDVARVSGLGVRQLQRRFLAATGLTVKSYSRVRRLRSALARQLAAAEPISRTAAEGGYADHSHLAREFADLTGMAPKNVLKHLARIHHRNVTP